MAFPIPQYIAFTPEEDELLDRIGFEYAEKREKRNARRRECYAQKKAAAQAQATTPARQSGVDETREMLGGA